MKKLALILSIASLSLSGIYSLSANGAVNQSTLFQSGNWYGNGDKTEYKIGFDTKEKYNGSKSILIESKVDKVKSDFSTILQSISADQYLGKRIRFSGYVKTQKAESASLWMRIDGENKSILQFDNMDKREIKGTNNWKKYDIVLDVTNSSNSIVLGGFLVGTGKAWFDSFKVEVVDKSVPSTNIEMKVKQETKNPNKFFSNLDFDL